MAEEKTTATGDKGLAELCSYIKKSIMSRKYDHAECALRIAKAMESYPDAAEPHNLLGILLEESGDHCGAMRHFRAAWALRITPRRSRPSATVFSRRRPSSASPCRF